MTPETHTSHHTAAEEPLVIQCVACHKSVAAPKTMIGQLVECPFCQHQFVIEDPAAAPITPARDPAVVKAELTSLEGQLKENLTQITELRGHVSRLNMELHRHQLRMQNLYELQTELQTGISAAKVELGSAE
jgi:uncharacterized paraquat-inducible protein A